MATGDVISALTSTAASGFLDVKPASGVEWVIHNLYHEAAGELYISDGTNSILLMTDSAQGGWIGFYLHVNNTRYLRIKNTDAGTKYLGYDGVITK